jgi:hypothetical protein
MELFDATRRDPSSPASLLIMIRHDLAECARQLGESSELLTHSLSEMLQGVPYEVLAGRVGRVAIVQDYLAGLVSKPGEVRTSSKKAVYIVFEDDPAYVATARDGIVDGLALVSDIELGRRKWRGLRVHPRILEAQWLLTYDADTGTYGSFPVSPADVLTVADVVVGFDQCSPARVILVTATGREGFRDVSVSGTNCGSTARIPTFTDRFEVMETAAEHN